MKRLLLSAVCIIFLTMPAVLHAQEKALLGKSNFALKLDYIVFTDSIFDSPLAEDDGVYVGIEGYGKISPNLYIGGEIGQGTNVDILGDEIDFFPVELNLKYAIETASNFVVDFGAGVSYSYTEVSHQGFFGPIETIDDWVWGGQLFGDLTYKINWFSIGLNAKYQFTEDFKDADAGLSNWRAGIQIGAVF